MLSEAKHLRLSFQRCRKKQSEIVRQVCGERSRRAQNDNGAWSFRFNAL